MVWKFQYRSLIGSLWFWNHNIASCFYIHHDFTNSKSLLAYMFMMVLKCPTCLLPIYSRWYFKITSCVYVHHDSGVSKTHFAYMFVMVLKFQNHILLIGPPWLLYFKIASCPSWFWNEQDPSCLYASSGFKIQLLAHMVTMILQSQLLFLFMWSSWIYNFTISLCLYDQHDYKISRSHLAHMSIMVSHITESLLAYIVLMFFDKHKIASCPYFHHDVDISKLLLAYIFTTSLNF